MIDNMKTLMTLGGIYNNGGAASSPTPHEISPNLLGQVYREFTQLNDELDVMVQLLSSTLS